MQKLKPVLCTLIADHGIEIVTVGNDSGDYVTQINGGKLDGETFRCRENPEGQHEWARSLALSAANPPPRGPGPGSGAARAAKRSPSWLPVSPASGPVSVSA